MKNQVIGADSGRCLLPIEYLVHCRKYQVNSCIVKFQSMTRGGIRLNTSDLEDIKKDRTIKY